MKAKNVIFVVLAILLFSGCCSRYVLKEEVEEIVEKRLNLNRSLEKAFDNFQKKTKYNLYFKEWMIVNEKKLISACCYSGYCGYTLIDEKDNMENIYKGYFSYTTKEKLEKKWKNKPKPKGLKLFLDTELKPIFYM